MEKTSSFAKRLRLALELRGMKAADLCKRTGASRGAVSHYLKGDHEAKYNVVSAFADELEVSETWLLGYSSDEDILTGKSLVRDKINQRLDALTEDQLKKVLAFMENCL